MDNFIKISDFAKLTKSTVKTIMYYHKIGLLKEPKRSASRYRIYGAEELTRMRIIGQLKSLGLDLKQIKEILGDVQNHKTLSQVLESLYIELLNEKKKIENQMSKVEKLLSQGVEAVKENSVESNSLQMILERLRPEQMEDYKQISTELYEHQNNVFGMIESFQWGKDYQSNFNTIADYFKEHPQKYKEALEFGKRFAKLSQMSDNDPEIEQLAREGAEFIKNTPFLKEMLYGKSGFGEPYESTFNDMLKKVESPAHMKHKQLIQKYLEYEP